MSPEVPTFVRALLATCLEPPGPCLICISFTQMFIKINALRHNICLRLSLLDRQSTELLESPGHPIPHPIHHPIPHPILPLEDKAPGAPLLHQDTPGLQSKEGKSCDFVLEREFVRK